MLANSMDWIAPDFGVELFHPNYTVVFLDLFSSDRDSHLISRGNRGREKQSARGCFQKCKKCHNSGDYRCCNFNSLRIQAFSIYAYNDELNIR